MLGELIYPRHSWDLVTILWVVQVVSNLYRIYWDSKLELICVNHSGTTCKLFFTSCKFCANLLYNFYIAEIYWLHGPIHTCTTFLKCRKWVNIFIVPSVQLVWKYGFMQGFPITCNLKLIMWRVFFFFFMALVHAWADLASKMITH